MDLDVPAEESLGVWWSTGLMLENGAGLSGLGGLGRIKHPPTSWETHDLKCT